ncbi:MAG: mammalian cell entry protein [Pseudonocardiales bacterium]|nr:MAG: mammalian cell entry protein [Pseudonocardiales bacterium]
MRRLVPTAAFLLSLLLLSGCGFSLYDVQLPGSAATGSHVYRVTAEFSDVLDLVPQSAVKVDDVTVGSVEKITLKGFTAVVRMRVRDSVKLPDNAEAAIRQTSLLGEKFVSLSPPTCIPPAGASSCRAEPPQGALGDGDVIPLARTTHNSTEVEEVLSALSLLLNGGGLGQLQTINAELSKALTGREPDVRDLLAQLNTFVGGLDAQKKDIVRAINGLDRLSTTLSAQRTTIDTALVDLGPGLQVLANERQQFTAMLAALAKLGVVGTRVVQATHDDLIANLQALQPILANLAAAGKNLPGALELLTTYPFPRNFGSATTGNFTRLSITVDVSLATLVSNLALAGTPPGAQAVPGAPAPLPLPASPGLPGLPSLPGLPGLPGLPLLPGQQAPAGTQASDLVGLLLGGLHL